MKFGTKQLCLQFIYA